MMMSEMRFTGYLRPDGGKGVRDLTLVIYTVECAKFVAHAIARDEPDTQVIGFPGCYDNEYAIRLMLAMGRHPNVGAVLAVGLGCEYTQPKRLAEVVAQSGRPSEWFFIQDQGGTRSSIEEGKRRLAGLREQSAAVTQRVEMGLADLTIGCECGGSDATSGLAGNPAVGAFYDRLVDAGGTAVFEEIVEAIGCRDWLVGRGVDEAARESLAATYDKAENYCRSVRQWSASPGNFAGGLTTIEEKSLGALAKSGTRPIQGVVKVAEHPPRPGLWLLDTVPDPYFMQFGFTNPTDTEGIMALAATGAQIVLFVTGRGSVIGSAVAPLIKITGNGRTYEKLREDMDFDASRVLNGSETLEETGARLEQLVLETAAGQQTKPESLGHQEYHVIYKYQKPSGDGTALGGCRLEA